MSKITVDTRAFERNNVGRAPKPGRSGLWMFEVTGPAGTETLQMNGQYRDVLRKIKSAARNRNAYAIALCP